MITMLDILNTLDCGNTQLRIVSGWAVRLRNFGDNEKGRGERRVDLAAMRRTARKER